MSRAAGAGSDRDEIVLDVAENAASDMLVSQAEPGSRQSALVKPRRASSVV